MEKKDQEPIFMDEITFRDVTLADAERLLEIYGYYVNNTAITFECTMPTLEEFKGKIVNITRKYPYIVACENGMIIGICLCGSFCGLGGI